MNSTMSTVVLIGGVNIILITLTVPEVMVENGSIVQNLSSSVSMLRYSSVAYPYPLSTITSPNISTPSS